MSAAGEKLARLHLAYDVLLTQRDALEAREKVLRAELQRAMAVLIPMVDVGQRRLNGGPYCIHIEGDGFCGRAERWDGHHVPASMDWPGHKFVDGEWLYEAAALATGAPKP